MSQEYETGTIARVMSTFVFHNGFDTDDVDGDKDWLGLGIDIEEEVQVAFQS